MALLLLVAAMLQWPTYACMQGFGMARHGTLGLHVSFEYLK
jgi:hypothetical protein